MNSLKRKKISIITSCFNEEYNIKEFYTRTKKILDEHINYDYEIIIADNKSTDNTRTIIRSICDKDFKTKAIFNVRNYGPERSGMNALLASTGDAVVVIASDLQNPPELISQFIKKWEDGYSIVGAVKTDSVESYLMKCLRNCYYDLLKLFSSNPPLKNFTGFGLYDKVVIDNIRKIHDFNPFFRGLIAELGYEIGIVNFTQPSRKAGKSSYSFFSLINHGMLGLISQTQVPLRIATLSGFIFSIISFFVGVLYFIIKLLYWNKISIGIAPLVVGLFFFSSIQLFFIGIIGEYIGSIQTKVTKNILVVEKEKINF